MILVLGNECKNKVVFMEEDEKQPYFKGEFLTCDWKIDEAKERCTVVVGLGKKGADPLTPSQACAVAVKKMQENKVMEYSMDVSAFVKNDLDNLASITEGIYLGTYKERTFKNSLKTENDKVMEKDADLQKDSQKDSKKDSKNEEVKISLVVDGLTESQKEKAKTIIEEASVVAQSVCFARDMVNLPGNRLRPVDFAKQIEDFAKEAGVEVELFDADRLKEMGMEALLAVGDSSEFPPYLAVLRYHGAPSSDKVMGLVGKGVTCDTGGYCLKPADSMLGIKGDMAGGAAVAGAIAALSKNKVEANAVAVIPICENRISRGSLLPGDVIGSYGKKTIEIANTDAEGRLILADAVAYAVKDEKVTHILDIATLTGAVVGLLGFSIGGAICDNDEYYQEFEGAYGRSRERYLRVPFYDEHEKMIESRIADIRNMGEKFCGTITAGLFIRAFAEERPWLHLDIAGTAWVDTPVFAFQSKGATGAGVTTIYQLCKGGN